jgi:hypothetical protein
MKILYTLDPPEGGTPEAPTPPAPTPPPTPPQPPSAKGLEAVAKLAATFLGKEVPPETPEQKAEREKKEAAAAAAAAAKPKPAAKKPAPKPRPQLTAAEIAEASARGVATAMQTLKPATPEPAAASKPEDSLPEEEKSKVKVLRHMEQQNGDKYKGLTDKYVQSFIALQKYADDWEAKHPGENFNEDDEEHEAFFKSHDVDWDNEDFITSAVEIRASARDEERQREFNSKLSKLERQQKLTDSIPSIAATQAPAKRTFWTEAGEAFKGVLDENGQIVHAKYAELEQNDPDRLSLLNTAARSLDIEVAELYKVVNGLTDYNKDLDVHINVDRFCSEQEKVLMGAPEEERLNGDGKLFLPAARYYKLPKEQRSEYWTFSVADLAALRAKDLASLANKIADQTEAEHRKWAERRGMKPQAGQATPPLERRQPEPPEPESSDGKPTSPSSSSESRLAARRNAPENNGKPSRSSFLHTMLHGQS